MWLILIFFVLFIFLFFPRLRRATRPSLPPMAKQQVAAHVQRLIAENPVMVFSKTYCPYCVRAQQLLNKLKAPMKVVELNQLPGREGDDIQDYLEEFTNQDTVPNIFIHQRHVGGCDDIHALHAQGKLEPMIRGK